MAPATWVHIRMVLDFLQFQTNQFRAKQSKNRQEPNMMWVDGCLIIPPSTRICHWLLWGVHKSKQLCFSLCGTLPSCFALQLNKVLTQYCRHGRREGSQPG